MFNLKKRIKGGNDRILRDLRSTTQRIEHLIKKQKQRHEQQQKQKKRNDNKKIKNEESISRQKRSIASKAYQKSSVSRRTSFNNTARRGSKKRVSFLNKMLLLTDGIDEEFSHYSGDDWTNSDRDSFSLGGICSIDESQQSLSSQQQTNSYRRRLGDAMVSSRLLTKLSKRSMVSGRFIPFDRADEMEIISLLRRVSDIVVYGKNPPDRRESLGGSSRNLTASLPPEEMESVRLSVMEQLSQTNGLRLIIDVITGVAFSIDGDRTSRYLPPLPIAIQGIQSLNLILQSVSPTPHSLALFLGNNLMNDLVELPLESYAEGQMLLYKELEEEQMNSSQRLHHHPPSAAIDYMPDLTNHFISFLSRLAATVNAETIAFFVSLPPTTTTDNNNNSKVCNVPLYDRALTFISSGDDDDPYFHGEDPVLRVMAMTICLIILRLVAAPYISDESFLKKTPTTTTTTTRSKDDTMTEATSSTLSSSSSISSSTIAPILPPHYWLALSRHVAGVPRVRDLISPICSRIMTICYELEDTVRFWDEEEQRQKQHKQCCETMWEEEEDDEMMMRDGDGGEDGANVGRAGMMTMAEIGEGVNGIMEDLRNEWSLLDSVLKIDLVNKQAIEMLFTTVINPLLLRPLLLCYAQRSNISRERQKQQQQQGHDTTTPNDNYTSFETLRNCHASSYDYDEDEMSSSHPSETSSAKSALLILSALFSHISEVRLLHKLFVCLFHPLAGCSMINPSNSHDATAHHQQQRRRSSKKGNPQRRALLACLSGSEGMLPLQSAGLHLLMTAVTSLNNVNGEGREKVMISDVLLMGRREALSQPTAGEEEEGWVDEENVMLFDAAFEESLEELHASLGELFLDDDDDDDEETAKREVVDGGDGDLVMHVSDFMSSLVQCIVTMESEKHHNDRQDGHNNETPQVTYNTKAAGLLLNLLPGSLSVSHHQNPDKNKNDDKTTTETTSTQQHKQHLIIDITLQILRDYHQQTAQFINDHVLPPLLSTSLQDNEKARSEDSQDEEMALNLITDRIVRRCVYESRTTIQWKTTTTKSNNTKEEKDKNENNQSSSPLVVIMVGTTIPSSATIKSFTDGIRHVIFSYDNNSNNNVSVDNNSSINNGNIHQESPSLLPQSAESSIMSQIQLDALLSLIESKTNNINEFNNHDKYIIKKSIIMAPLSSPLHTTLFPYPSSKEERGPSLIPLNLLPNTLRFQCACIVSPSDRDHPRLKTPTKETTNAMMTRGGVTWISLYLVFNGDDDYVSLVTLLPHHPCVSGRLLSSYQFSQLSLEEDTYRYNPQKHDIARRVLLKHMPLPLSKTTTTTTTTTTMDEEQQQEQQWPPLFFVKTQQQQQHVSRSTCELLFESRMELWFRDQNTATSVYETFRDKISKVQCKRGEQLRRVLFLSSSPLVGTMADSDESGSTNKNVLVSDE